MKTLRLPETETLFKDQAYSPGTFISLFSLINSHKTSPSLILVGSDLDLRLILFILEKRPYAAGKLLGDRFEPLSLREYFKAVSGKKQLMLTLNLVSPVFFKSLMVIVQKLPTSGGTTDLVNVEVMLDRVKASKKEAVITVKRMDDLSFFYFSDGRLHDAYFANPKSVSQESSLEDQFLECIYTASDKSPVVVQTYEDVGISPAEDHNLQWEDSPDGIVEYFLRPRPELVFMSNGTIFNKSLLKQTFTIGRSPDCDAILSDIKSSRTHAIIKEEKGTFILEDLKSRNGTKVNDLTVTRTSLQSGDEIQIGNTRIVFSEPERTRESTDPFNSMDSETTQINLENIPNPKDASSLNPPQLGLVLVNGPKQGLNITLEKKFTIGRSKMNLNLNDHKVSRKHCEIVKRENGYYYIDLNSTNGSFINNQPVHEKILNVGDMIKVGDTLIKVYEKEDSS